jgi:hypothetical protein
MSNCCDDYGNCRQGRDCPVRIERIRCAKERLDQDQPSIPFLLIGRLALGAAILLAIFIGSMWHEAVRAVS